MDGTQTQSQNLTLFYLIGWVKIALQGPAINYVIVYPHFHRIVQFQCQKVNSPTLKTHIKHDAFWYNSLYIIESLRNTMRGDLHKSDLVWRQSYRYIYIYTTAEKATDGSGQVS